MNYTQELGNLWLCLDCTQQAEGNPHIMRGNLLTPNWDIETGEGFADFSREWCAYCNTSKGGFRHRFTLWGN